MLSEPAPHRYCCCMLLLWRPCARHISVCKRVLERGLVHAAGLAQPGKIERGARAASCKNHLHQLHVCLPAGPGRTRLLYRMSMDFLHWTKAVPGIQAFWAHIAQQVLCHPSHSTAPDGAQS